MNNSAFGTINWKDFFKGLLYAVSSAVIAFILPIIQAGSFVINWKQLGGVAISVMIAYIGNKFFQNTNGDVAKSDPPLPIIPPKV